MEDTNMEMRLKELIWGELYTISEIGKVLNISSRTLRRYCEEKVFEHSIKIGKKGWLIPGGDVLELCGIERHRRRPVFVASKIQEMERKEKDEHLSW